MKIKPILAELFKNIALPMDEYRSLKEAQFFFDHISLLEEVEHFHLPEITKVICSNESLLSVSSFSQYKIIRDIYVAQDNAIYLQILENHDPNDIINDVIPLIDEITLRKIYSFRDAWISNKNKLIKDKKSKKGDLQSLESKLKENQDKLSKKESERNSYEPTEENKKRISNLKSTITKLKKQIETNQTDINSTEVDLKEIETQLHSISNLLERNANLFKAIDYTLEEYNQITSIARDEIYKLAIDSPAKILIDRVITDDDTPEQRENLRNEAFCHSMVAEFSSYDKLTAIDVITKLYFMGDIDINEGVFQDYILNHMSDVCGYMASQYRDMTPEQNESYKSWIEFILEQLASSGYEAYFSIYMNSISQNETWKYILESIITEYQEHSLDLLCVLCLNVEGTSGKILMSYLKSMIATGDIFGYTVSEFTTTLLSKECNAKSRQIVRDIIQRYETDLKSAKRKINVAERESAERSAEIFRSLYKSIESLEILATNYASSKNQLPHDVMKKNLMASVTHLRISMENLEVYPVESADTWTFQTDIDYNAETHECNRINVGDKVKLRTMGFKYRDSDGEWHVIPAKVIKVPPKSFNLTSSKSKDKSQRDTGNITGHRKSKSPNKCHLHHKGDKK